MSVNGAKLLLNKGPPRKATIEDMSDAVAAPTIITPHALPMFRDSEVGRSTKRKREKERMDPRKSRRPELPVTGPGRGGRVGASATQHVVQNLVRDTTRDEDVRAIVVLVHFWLCLRVIMNITRFSHHRHRWLTFYPPSVVPGAPGWPADASVAHSSCRPTWGAIARDWQTLEPPRNVQSERVWRLLL